MSRLTEHVEKNVVKLFPVKIALFIEGLTARTTHSLAVHASFRSESANSHDVRLLKLSNCEYETSLDVQQNADFPSFTSSNFEKS